MTHNLALRGLRHAAHHVCPVRADAKTIVLSQKYTSISLSDLKQIRNASTASATADHQHPDRLPQWGSLTRKSAPNTRAILKPTTNEDAPDHGNNHRASSKLLGTSSHTADQIDSSHTQEPENASGTPLTGSSNHHEKSRSYEDTANKPNDPTSRPSIRIGPRSIGDGLLGEKQPTQPLAPELEEDAEAVRALYELLRSKAGLGKTHEVDEIVQQLVAKYGEAPNLRLYSALILVNHNYEFGSAAEVEQIVQEMRDEMMEPDETCYHNVLKVLAVHPDCFLRDRIVAEMRERWIRISVHGMHDIIAGQIREGLIEQALDLFDSDRELKRTAPKWLKDMFIYHLCDLGELDQALKMIKDRVALGEVNISPSVWYYFFDAACTELHHDSIQFVWQQRVERKHLNPSSGQCLQALIVTARTGDVQIATDIFRILSQRGISFKPYHYELLIAAQIRAGDVRTALIIVCIMHAVHMKPTNATLSPLLHYLAEDPARPAEAFEILKELREERQVPTVAINTIIASLVRHNMHEEVITTYKSLHRICKQGPTVDTFNTLFRSCHRNNDKKTAMFFAAEMVELKIRPNYLTYDRLLLTCLKEKDYEDALRYYEEMMHSGYQPRGGTWLAMVQVCCDARDKRAFELVRKMEEIGMQTSLCVQYLKENWPEAADEAFGLYSSTID